MVNITVVIGANYGDEGKGHMVDYLADRAAKRGKRCLVVLSNGGAQRGHTVCTSSRNKHTFKHFGSGMFAWADTLIPKTFIVNPMMFEQEHRSLSGCGWSNVYLTTSCMLTTPYEMIANMLIEDARGDQRHGSCGCGIWETIVCGGAKVGEFLGMTHGQRVEYLKFVRDDYLYDRLSKKGVKVYDQWHKVLKSDEMIENYIDDFNRMIKCVTLVNERPWNTVWNYEEVIFENGQGLLLGEEYGDTKHGTPSYTGLRNPVELIRDYYRNLNFDGMSDIPLHIDVCYVSRTYQTRHGMGPFPYECPPYEISLKFDFRHETNHENTYQGALRYGKLYWKDLSSRIKKDYESNIGEFRENSRWVVAMTHADEVFPDDLQTPSAVKYISYGRLRENIVERHGIVDFL